MLSYLVYMADRIAAKCDRVLKEPVSFYLHCDPTASHYLKTILDCVFGANNFRNEIIWCYSSTSQATKWYPKKHDVLLYYATSNRPKFNPLCDTNSIF